MNVLTNSFCIKMFMYLFETANTMFLSFIRFNMVVEWLFLAVPWGCLRFVIVIFPDHTHLLFFSC